jgi:hypothetical protein
MHDVKQHRLLVGKLVLQSHRPIVDVFLARSVKPSECWQLRLRTLIELVRFVVVVAWWISSSKKFIGRQRAAPF